jgi:hypothetical protein
VIKGLSDKRRLPRLGKVKLGIVILEPGKKPYPRATDYFVVPAGVQAALGEEQPKRLPIMFPVDDPAVVFPQELKCYKESGLWCRGDGERAHRWDERGELVERPCPCELLDAGKCKPLGTLSFFLPDVPGIGVWQLSTSSQRSIVSLNSCLESFARTFGGLRGIPFDLVLEPEMIQRFDEKRGAMVKQTLQVLRLDSTRTLKEILDWRSKMGKPIEALMPSPEPDDEDRAGEEPPAGNGRSERAAPPEAPGPVPPPTIPPEEFDISLAYKTAVECLGVTAHAYGLYLRATYGVGADDITPAQLGEQARLMEKAKTDAVSRESLKADVIAGANKAAGKRGGAA